MEVSDNVYDVTFPPTECGIVSYYFATRTAEGNGA